MIDKELVEFSFSAASKGTNALRAVIELHSPEGQPDQQCRCCKKIYPCPTIREIEKELK